MTDEIILRDVVDSDLPIFFEQQLDADANYMAAFTAKDPADRDAFMAHWARIRGDPSNQHPDYPLQWASVWQRVELRG